MKTKLQAACDAAERYAQLVHYHDRRPGCLYDNRPVRAWAEFIGQFTVGYNIGNNTAVYAAVAMSFVREMRRLSNMHGDPNGNNS